MGRYLSTAPRVKKQQVFTVSGTFTPSPGLLAAGGVVEVRCVGGGGAGGGTYNGDTGSNWNVYRGGGGSGADICRIVTVTAPVAIVIGAGGSGSDGGATKFGNLVIANGGKKPASFIGGDAGGLGGFAGESGSTSSVSGGNGGGSVGGQGGGAGNGGPNSGGGGAYNSSGYSGICIVTWEE